MVVIRVVLVLSSPVFSSLELLCWVQFGSESLFIVHAKSLVVCSHLSLHTWCAHLVHLVTWSFYFEYVLFSFLMSTFYIFCVDMCYAFNMRHIFTLASWSLGPDLSWKILSLLTWDQEIDLECLRLWPISPSDQSNTISTYIYWRCRLDDLPILSLTWHHSLVPLHDFTTLVRFIMLQYHWLFFPSFPWSDQVEFEMVRPEVSFTRW